MNLSVIETKNYSIDMIKTFVTIHNNLSIYVLTQGDIILYEDLYRHGDILIIDEKVFIVYRHNKIFQYIDLHEYDMVIPAKISEYIEDIYEYYDDFHKYMPNLNFNIELDTHVHNKLIHDYHAKSAYDFQVPIHNTVHYIYYTVNRKFLGYKPLFTF
jgi:hypothetical protein